MPGTRFPLWPFAFCITAPCQGQNLHAPEEQSETFRGQCGWWSLRSTHYPEQKHKEIIKASFILCYFQGTFRQGLTCIFLLNNIPIYKQRN